MVELLGGMAQKRQLVRLGVRDLDLTRAVRGGDVIRARQGWYTVLAERSPAVQAVRVGGRLTGLSALHELGAWMLASPTLHVSVPANAARLRTRWNRHRLLDVGRTRGVIVHWESPELASRGTATSVGLRDALVRVILDESPETAIAALDWATHVGLLDEIDRAELALTASRRRRNVVASVDRECQSLPESLARTRLKAAGHRVRSQVPVGDSEFIDLVIDDRIGLEVDGYEFHAATFERDRAKDTSIAVMGLLPLRVSAKAVFGDWDRVMLAIDAMLGNSGVVAQHAPRSAANRPMVRGRRAATPEFPKGMTRVQPDDGAAQHRGAHSGSG